MATHDRGHPAVRSRPPPRDADPDAAGRVTPYRAAHAATGLRTFLLGHPTSRSVGCEQSLNATASPPTTIPTADSRWLAGFEL
ncbi:MAG: hypothetical protein ACK55I_19150, partial [bacterium]